MRADTGVGPSIASSNQDCSGNCADLPHAASNSASPIQVSVDSLAAAGSSSTPENVTEPNVTNINMMAIDRPTSPTRLTTKAFFAATAADGLYCQKPMSR